MTSALDDFENTKEICSAKAASWTSRSAWILLDPRFFCWWEHFKEHESNLNQDKRVQGLFFMPSG